MATEPNITTQIVPDAIPPFDPVEAEQQIWLAERRKHVGSSDASALFGEGFGCPRRLVYSKRNTPVDFSRTEQEEWLLEAGHRLEDTVAREFIEDCNNKLEPLGIKPWSLRRMAAKVCKDNPDLAANIDRQIVGVTPESLRVLFPSIADSLGDVTGPIPIICEIKTTNSFVLKRAKFEGASLDWLLQVQEQFCVVPHKLALIVAKARDTWETLAIPVQPDKELMAEISRRATAIMDVVRDATSDLPPTLPHGDKRCGNCQWRRTCLGEQVNLVSIGTDEETGTVEYETDDSLATLVNDYKTLRFQIDDQEMLLKAIAEEIKTAMGEREAVYVPAACAKVLYKTGKPSMVWDGKALDADHSELAAKYKKPKKASRTFRVMDAE